ncbi:uncharacterized protein LOC122160563 isoform X4 [Centrocercus urophasianus]|uniref:uncharacterized protein LOC122160563 isoform X4 n=1 Tax=Centrocercus urophasianus TaxID=9002 RepID=UPI001C649BB1|nr:uncharacterized protein LOC122160563 isoform X4 [Centrocercus urophasianus]
MIPIFPRGLLTIVSTKDAEWDILEIFLGGLLKAFHTAYSDHRMLHRSRLQSSLPIITSRENEVKGRAEQGILASPTRPDLEEQTEVLQSTGQWGGNISLCPAQFTADQRKEFFTLLSFCWSKTIRITDGFLARCSLAGRQFGVYKRFNENLAFSQLLANTLGLSSHTSKLRS